MPNKYFIFPTPLDATATLTHDQGWTVPGVADTHPTGRTGQSFTIPAGTPDLNGARLLITYPGLDPIDLRGVFKVADLSSLAVDDFKLQGTLGSAFAPVSIVGDHFEAAGRRWTWRMTTGFCDYKVFLDGGDIRGLLKQNQDLGAHGRRVFLNMVNITDFNPDAYGDAFYGRLPEFVALNAEYEQYVDFNVLPDTQYRGWSLAKCQNFWARVNDALNSANWNHFRSLTNEFDHGGNLVGNPNDYARPGYALLSQGSAVQDATPPCPATGKGAGWGYWEWHAADEPTKFSHEYYIWQGLSTGAIKPCVISEHGRRINEGNADLNYIRSMAFASCANGCGMTVHTEDGKYSRLVGPNQAACIKTVMDILNKV